MSSHFPEAFSYNIRSISPTEVIIHGMNCPSWNSESKSQAWVNGY